MGHPLSFILLFLRLLHISAQENPVLYGIH